jgi:O-acetyl-ADP-ribose deacetylase (regulator of RNase III)
VLPQLVDEGRRAERWHISFPAISTGIFGYPLDAATDIAVETVRSSPTPVATVRFVCFDKTTLQAYRERLER